MHAYGRCFRRAALPAALLGTLGVGAGCGTPASPSPPIGSLSHPRSSDGEVLEQKEMTPGAASMAELIESRLPNVYIRRNGGRAWIEIRGQGTINAGTEALIIVDGIELTSSGFLSMNPDDVHRIEVLRDGSAAIYGIRAANGVLVVTTRRQGQ